MEPKISEFSYGYALTEELANWPGAELSAYPLFPSLNAEGRLGYDLRLIYGSVPLFLQFKLSHLMVRSYVKEVLDCGMQEPLFRFYLHATRHSRQHPTLLDLEVGAGNLVYYAAPAFHEGHELNEFYLRKKVFWNSCFVPPSSIGRLPDDERHSVGFKSPWDNKICVCSESFVREGAFSAEALLVNLEGKLENEAGLISNEDKLRHFEKTIFEILLKNNPIQEILAEQATVAERPLRPDLPTIAFLLKTVVGCELFFVKRSPR
ncbi:hypothetical protein AAU61_05035 [Desulfocarbo indianensis]|nr:hypothetical protein AAU61_05035 [Desulfocarbo indianensis]